MSQALLNFTCKANLIFITTLWVTHIVHSSDKETWSKDILNFNQLHIPRKLQNWDSNSGDSTSLPSCLLLPNSLLLSSNLVLSILINTKRLIVLQHWTRNPLWKREKSLFVHKSRTSTWFEDLENLVISLLFVKTINLQAHGIQKGHVRYYYIPRVWHNAWHKNRHQINICWTKWMMKWLSYI